MTDIKEHWQVWSISFFDKKIGSGMSVNEQVVKELHKPVIKNFKRKKVYARFKDNIWASKKNKC